MNRNTYSPQKEQKKSVDTKRGIFVTKNISQQKPSVLPYLNTSLQGLKQGLENLKNLNSSMEADKKKQTINIINSQQMRSNMHTITNTANLGSQSNLNNHNIYVHQVPRSTTPTKVHFHYPGGNPGYSFIPGSIPGHTPHSQTFTSTNINSSLNAGQQIHYVPIAENGQTIQIKRTIVPYQVTNQIPARIVVNPPMNAQMTPPFRPSNPASQSDQAYQILLKQYQKLYDKLLKQSSQNQQLQQTIKQLRLEISHNQSHSHVINNNMQSSGKSRRVSLNIQQLHEKLYKIYEKAVKDIINARKQAARGKLAELFGAAKKEVSAFTSTEEVVERTWSYAA